jgi:gas vesicle protein
MMDNATLQAIIGHLNELKTELKMDISASETKVKDEICAVYDGQEDLKNDMKSEISAVKNDISAVRDDIENSISAVKDEVSAVKNELRREICDFQERIRAGQDEFEERVTYAVEARLEDVSSMVDVISSQVLFHNGSVLHSMFNTQLLITINNSSTILTHV